MCRVEDTKVSCCRIQGCVKLLLSLSRGEVGVQVGEGGGERGGERRGVSGENLLKLGGPESGVIVCQVDILKQGDPDQVIVGAHQNVVAEGQDLLKHA